MTRLIVCEGVCRGEPYRLDCRRINLRWATPRMNAANRFGSAWRQPAFPFPEVRL